MYIVYCILLLLGSVPTSRVRTYPTRIYRQFSSDTSSNFHELKMIILKKLSKDLPDVYIQTIFI